MKFEDALKAMREGKRVRRKGWAATRQALTIKRDCWREIFLTRNKAGRRSSAIFLVCDILAEDWQVVEGA